MWFQLQITDIPRDKIDEFSEQLEINGALSVSLTDKNDDPVLEPAPKAMPLWPEVVIQALFNTEKAAQEAAAICLATYPQAAVETMTLPEQDWERAWMTDFKPQQFGQKLWICPSWCAPPVPEAVNLMLDPGLAFGTGTHPTTALCLRWLDKAPLEGQIVIDYGCGSGILGLAALKLGAKKVYAVDIDEQALLATRDNALKNHIAIPEHLEASFPEGLTCQADLLLANILQGPLLALQSCFRQLLKNKSVLVLSGLLENQAAKVIAAYQPDFTLQNKAVEGEWCLLHFTLNLSDNQEAPRHR